MRQLENWYLVRDRQFSGPFSGQQIGQMLKAKSITYDDWIYTHGQDGWMQVRSISAFFLHNLPIESNVKGDPRAELMGQVIMHDKEKLIIGSCVNVSRSGLLVTSEVKPFQLGTRLNVTLKSTTIIKPLNLWGKIIRVANPNKERAEGYGIQFDTFHDELESQGFSVAA